MDEAWNNRLMLTRVVAAIGSVLALLAALLFGTPSPQDAVTAWPGFVIGAAVLAAVALWPALLSGMTTWITVGVSTILGVGGGLLHSKLSICCMYLVTESYGYPFGWMARHAEYESLTNNRPPASFDDDAVWSVEWFTLLTTLAFWVCAAVALVVLVRLALSFVRFSRRSRGRQAAEFATTSFDSSDSRRLR